MCIHFKIIDKKNQKIEGVEKERKSWEKLNHLFLEIYYSLTTNKPKQMHIEKTFSPKQHLSYLPRK